MVGKYTCITFCLIEKQSIFYFFKVQSSNIADILFCEDVVSLTDIHVVNTRKKFLICNFTDMNVLFENKAVPWSLGGGRHSELKIAGLADVLTLSNG